MHPVKIGVCLRFKNVPLRLETWDTVYREHLEYGSAADRLGFDGLWVPEHHCMSTGYNPAPLIALTALAGATKRCFLGTQPLVMPLHNPVLAAEEIAVLDVISGGRVALGLGAGYTASDFDALGISIRERGSRSEEALGVIKRALHGEAFDFKGRHYDLKGVKLTPPPLQKNMEIQLMVASAAAAKRAARHGVDVNLLSTEGLREYGPACVEAAAEVGRNPKEIGVSIMIIGFIGRSREAAVAAARPYLMFQAEEYAQNAQHDPAHQAAAEALKASYDRGDGPFTAAEWVETIQKNVQSIVDLGLKPSWINVTLWHAGMPVPEAIEALEQFSADVLPQLPH
jgi:alkanesulfonate monooxygenase SsuD/methylene tetrahydromethanopterin reductase-like flavin-dependent oxidoreductase (luciferase family)